MAAVALGAGRHMRAVLAGGRAAVVTGIAGLGNALVREVGDSPVTGRMATVALFAGLNVPRGFTGGAGAVVATRTGATADIAVVEKDHPPVVGHMTGIAILIGLDMVAMLAC